MGARIHCVNVPGEVIKRETDSGKGFFRQGVREWEDRAVRAEQATEKVG
jgi:NAD dependent epimerase/dehydratase family enzyme